MRAGGGAWVQNVLHYAGAKIRKVVELSKKKCEFVFFSVFGGMVRIVIWCVGRGRELGCGWGCGNGRFGNWWAFVWW